MEKSYKTDIEKQKREIHREGNLETKMERYDFPY